MLSLLTRMLPLLMLLGCGSEGEKNNQQSKGSADASKDPKDDRPQIVFVSPTQDLETDQDIEVKVKINGNTKRLKWNLAFKGVGEKTETPIAEDLEARQTTVKWATATVTPGTYTLVASFSSPAGKGKALSKAKIELKEVARPSVTLKSPAEEKVLLTSSPQQISFGATDPNGQNLTYTIELSGDNGKSWTTVAQDLTTTTYPWDIKKLAQGAQYKLKITATNSRGVTGTTEMTKPFGVAAEPVTYATSFGAFLSAKCAACHASGTVNADKFRCDSYDLATTGVSAKQDSIKKRTQDGTMPPNGSLTEAEKDIVTLWIWGGGQ